MRRNFFFRKKEIRLYACGVQYVVVCKGGREKANLQK